MKNLKINKNTVYVFNVLETFDKKNGNSYRAFAESFSIKNSKRKYFDKNIKGWNENKAFYSYNDAYKEVKHWLNDNVNERIIWLSQYPNIIVISKEVDYNEFKRITN